MTDRLAGFIAYFVPVTRNSTLEALEVNEFAFYTFGLLLFEKIAVDEIFCIQFGNPS